jgi:CxxC motif-containing protein (DUF1111 family)
MTRKLILLFALSVAAVTVGISTYAQQPPTGTPTDLVAMTEPPIPAPAGFNNKTNGFTDQAEFDKDREAFEDVETIVPEEKSSASRSQTASNSDETQTKGGLGPVYNATSCVSCHQNPITGSSSQVSELRAGRRKDPGDPNSDFIEPPGGSLIHQRAIDSQIQDRVRDIDTVRTLRMSTNTLGNGFVEVIQDRTILDICKEQKSQHPGMEGLPIPVPVAVRVKTVSEEGEPEEFEFVLRLGRFGWKAQEASLLNFSAGAYLNEMGITSPLQPRENTSNGRDVSQFDLVADPEDEAERKPNIKPKKHEDFERPFGEDVEAFARFMRSTKVPPRDFALSQGEVCKTADDTLAGGEKIFHDLGCAVCHKPRYVTPKAGTVIEPLAKRLASIPGTDFGRDFETDSKKGIVPDALGNKIICPFSDFMLHNIGTGDGIVQTQHAQRPARGAGQFLREIEQSPEIQQLRQQLTPQQEGQSQPPRAAVADRCDWKQHLLDVQKFDETGARVLDQRTANEIRTAPLWGLRVRPQLLHDGRALTISEAIRAHRNQADRSGRAFEALERDAKTDANKAADLQNLLNFLNSL